MDCYCQYLCAVIVNDYIRQCYPNKRNLGRIIVWLQKLPEEAKNPSHDTDIAGNAVETLVCEYSATDESLQVKESIVKLIRLLDQCVM